MFLEMVFGAANWFVCAYFLRGCRDSEQVEPVSRV